jgi:hypothetical protein
LHALYHQCRCPNCSTTVALADKPQKKFNQKKWDAAIKHLHSIKKIKPTIVNDAPIKALSRETETILLQALTDGIADNVVPPALLNKLQNDVFVFSGFKTYNSLKTASALLLTADGKPKPFAQFAQEVAAIHSTYNQQYLQAEYYFAVGSAQMAARWANLDADGNYHLQYRTAGDSRVRASHAALRDTTLPIDDPFWDEYMPPNGWRCFVAGTKIRCLDGWKNIEEIKRLDVVIGGSGNPQFVVDTHANMFNDYIITLFAKGIQISCTPNHRHFTSRGWVASENINAGDILVQVGKVGTLNKAGNAIHNLYILFLYGFMTLKRKWKTITALQVNSKS